MSDSATNDANYILIADDDVGARMYATQILEDAGYKIIQAIDGGSARKVVHEHQVIVAIIDHYMEPEGGLEFARDMRYDGFDLPMLLVTSEETTDLLFEATEAGFIGYLMKPVDPKRLVQAVERMIRLHHVNQKAKEERTPSL